MDKIISCEFNIDTACVEVKYADGSMISIDCTTEQTPCFGYDDANSILEMLYYYYTMANPVDNAVIRCQFKELNDVLCHLSLSENESVFALTGDLCVAYERQAFLDGIHVGMRLFSELNELPEK